MNKVPQENPMRPKQATFDWTQHVRNTVLLTLHEKMKNMLCSSEPIRGPNNKRVYLRKHVEITPIAHKERIENTHPYIITTFHNHDSVHYHTTTYDIVSRQQKTLRSETSKRHALCFSSNSTQVRYNI
eukprot:scaffold9748_cov111-Cylindrotheca_fusiformis.AAC.1